VILKYYRLYRISPSDYVTNCAVSPIVGAEKSIISDSVISELLLDFDTGYLSKSVEQESAEARTIHAVTRRPRSGRIVTPVNFSNKECGKRYPGRNKQPLRII